jgi:hypothetical protein
VYIVCGFKTECLRFIVHGIIHHDHPHPHPHPRLLHFPAALACLFRALRTQTSTSRISTSTCASRGTRSRTSAEDSVCAARSDGGGRIGRRRRGGGGCFEEGSDGFEASCSRSGSGSESGCAFPFLIPALSPSLSSPTANLTPAIESCASSTLSTYSVLGCASTVVLAAYSAASAA